MSSGKETGRRIAFFGGSFDPPHLGHLAVARAAQAALVLDTVLFAPVGAQPLKPLGSAASFEERVAMTRLALAGEPGFELSLADAPQPAGEPNFTIDTLLRLRAEMPAGGSLFCLMGADAFALLRKWHRGAEIPFVAPLIVASRPGEQLNELLASLPAGLKLTEAKGGESAGNGVALQEYVLHGAGGQAAPFYLLPGLEIAISATEIREQVRAAASSFHGGRRLLPEAVAEYIRAQRLYG